MSITDKEAERLREIIEGLEPELKNLGDRARDFVKDQIVRFETYGQGIRLSVKQWDWLESLYQKHAVSQGADRGDGVEVRRGREREQTGGDLERNAPASVARREPVKAVRRAAPVSEPQPGPSYKDDMDDEIPF